MNINKNLSDIYINSIARLIIKFELFLTVIFSNMYIERRI